MWIPWPDGKPFKAHVKPALSLVEPKDRSGSGASKALRFEPLMDNVAALLASNRLQRVVGVIIEATPAADEEEFYLEKMRQLERLCDHIRMTSSPDELLIGSVNAFHVWFVVNSFDSKPWSRWEERAREIVTFRLSPRVEVYYLPMGPFIETMAASFLKNTWHFLERAGLR